VRLLLLLLLFAIPAEAQTVRLRTVYYAHPDAISVMSAYYIHRKLPEFWKREFGLRLVPKRFEIKELPGPHCQTLSGFRNLSCWRAVQRTTKRARSKQTATLAIVPPLLDDGVKLFGGLGSADSYGKRAGLAMAHCADTNSDGKDRTAACHLIACHELGHNFGLRHYNREPNFMMADVAEHVDVWGWRPKVLRLNRKQFKRFFSQ
jgi:hypothetical protein